MSLQHLYNYVSMYRSLFNRVSVIAAPSREEMLKISKMFDLLIYKTMIRTNVKKKTRKLYRDIGRWRVNITSI